MRLPAKTEPTTRAPEAARIVLAAALVVAGCGAHATRLGNERRSAGSTTATPVGLALIERELGGVATVSPAEVSDLGWDLVPEGTRLEAVRLAGPGGPVVAYLHPRRGRWLSRGEQRPEPARRFIGVIEDALVFAGDDPEAASRLFELGHGGPPRNGAPLEGFDDRGLGAGLARAPERLRFGVVEWGPFPYAVPREAAALVLNAQGVETAILRSISAEAAGPSQTFIAHAVK